MVGRYLGIFLSVTSLSGADINDLRDSSAFGRMEITPSPSSHDGYEGDHNRHDLKEGSPASVHIRALPIIGDRPCVRIPALPIIGDTPAAPLPSVASSEAPTPRPSLLRRLLTCWCC